jgi:hypothetical protein
MAAYFFSEILNVSGAQTDRAAGFEQRGVLSSPARYPVLREARRASVRSHFSGLGSARLPSSNGGVSSFGLLQETACGVSVADLTLCFREIGERETEC